jgi:antitoxin VapB
MIAFSWIGRCTNRFNLIWVVQPFSKKYFVLSRPQITAVAGRIDRYAGCVIYTNGIYQNTQERIMSATAKIFMHGRSQAVRLPKEFRFEGTEVRVSKVGDKVILEPMDKPPFDAEAWFARLDELGGRDFLPEGIPDDPPVEPDPRVFFDE